jgi:hypothetical protein
MQTSDRRSLRLWLLLGGPLFVIGGFLAAFTIVGAVLVFVGLGMLATAVLLFTPLSTRLAMLIGFVIFAALSVSLAIDLAQPGP